MISRATWLRVIRDGRPESSLIHAHRMTMSAIYDIKAGRTYKPWFRALREKPAPVGSDLGHRPLPDAITKPWGPATRGPAWGPVGRLSV